MNRNNVVSVEEMKDMAVEGEVLKSVNGPVVEGVIIPPDEDGNTMESFEIEAGLVDFDP